MQGVGGQKLAWLEIFSVDTPGLVMSTACSEYHRKHCLQSAWA